MAAPQAAKIVRPGLAAEEALTLLLAVREESKEIAQPLHQSKLAEPSQVVLSVLAELAAPVSQAALTV